MHTSLIRNGLGFASVLSRAALLSVVLLPTQSLAQPAGSGHGSAVGGVAGSGMGQGTASIQTRSDVRMSIESAGTTNRARLQSIGNAAGTKMADIRACYADVVKVRPTVLGTMRVHIVVPQAAHRNATIEVVPGSVQDSVLERCVQRALRGADMRTVEGPAEATVVLEFTNTAARGVQLTQQRSAQAQQVNVRTGANGAAEASAATLGGEVQLTVVAAEAATPEGVAAVQRGLRNGMPSFRDCRRRAGRRGQSPAGEITIDLRVGAHAVRQVTPGSSTVHDEKAPVCVANAVKRVALEPNTPPGGYRVTLRFAEAETIANARPEPPRAPTKKRVR